LAEKLLEQEVIFKEDLETIFGKRPWEKEEEVPVVEYQITEQIEHTENIESPASDEAEEVSAVVEDSQESPTSEENTVE
jgi:cell division protease FtsH